MNIKDMLKVWKEKDQEYKLGSALNRKTVIDKKELKLPYFEETFKVMLHLDQEEQRLSNEMSYTEEIEMYEKALEKVKTEDEYDHIEKNINRLKRSLKLNTNKISVTIPAEKVQVILDNHQVEKAKAEARSKQLIQDRNSIQSQVEELRRKEKEIEKEISKISKLIRQADVLPEFIKSEGNTVLLSYNKEQKTAVQPLYKTLLYLENWHTTDGNPYKTIKEVK
ncbi:zinc ribbon domain-containing protein [Salinicoccus sp. CNSTN-B1]